MDGLCACDILVNFKHARLAVVGGEVGVALQRAAKQGAEEFVQVDEEFTEGECKYIAYGVEEGRYVLLSGVGLL
jgi:hypothetical protein